MATGAKQLRRTIAMTIVFGIHGIFATGLILGTAIKFIPQLIKPVDTTLIKPEDLPPPKEPPPPPPDFKPPPVAPPPSLDIPIVQGPPSRTALVLPPAPKVEAPVQKAAPRITQAEMTARDRSSLAEACTSLYPSASRRLGEEGSVVLLIFVAPNGRATEAKVETSTGVQRLDDAGIKCMTLYGHFTPSTEDGKPVGSWKRIKYTWKLT
jgi:periplasmic protein TonB